MKNRLKLLVWLFALSGPLAAQSVSVNGPDGKLQLTVSCPSANGEVRSQSPTMESKCWNLLPWGWRQMWVISIEDCS